jgi:hypothetical protein
VIAIYLFVTHSVPFCDEHVAQVAVRGQQRRSVVALQST